jgi:hypothetical protein
MACSSDVIMPLPRVAPAIKHERVASPRCFAVLRGCGWIDERVGQEVLVRAALLCFALFPGCVAPERD